MWYNAKSIRGNPAIKMHLDPNPLLPYTLDCFISWGSTSTHNSGAFGIDGYYVDLEIGVLGECAREDGWVVTKFDLVGHMERTYRTLVLAKGAVEWLRSCVDVAGVEGLRALNARSGGELA